VHSLNHTLTHIISHTDAACNSVTHSEVLTTTASEIFSVSDARPRTCSVTSANMIGSYINNQPADYQVLLTDTNDWILARFSGSYCQMVRVSFTQNADNDISIAGVEARYKASSSGGCNSDTKVLSRWAESFSTTLVTTNSAQGYGVDDVDITCCDLCPAGYYCSTPSATPVLCDVDTYCLEGSSAETNCPGGNDVENVQGLKCANECNLVCPCVDSNGKYTISDTVTDASVQTLRVPLLFPPVCPVYTRE
jgi:hypothetical protein